MTRKGQIAKQREHVLDGRGAFNYGWNRRYGGVEMTAGTWMIVEERRENGEWRTYRYCNEFGSFASLRGASECATEEARQRREEIAAERAKVGWRTMRYPIEFADPQTRPHLPGRLPPEWDISLDARVVDGPSGMREIKHPIFVRDDGLRVDMRVKQLADGKWWMVVSASYSDEIPDWETMCAVKELFVGKGRHALQVHPRESEYVNVSITMLHIFVPLNGWTLPDFRPLL